MAFDLPRTLTQEDPFVATDHPSLTLSAVGQFPRRDLQSLDMLSSQRPCRDVTLDPALTDQHSMAVTGRQCNSSKNCMRPLDPSRSRILRFDTSLKAASSHVHQDSPRRTLASNSSQRLAPSNQSNGLAPLRLRDTKESDIMACNPGSDQLDQLFAMEDYIDFTLYDGDQDMIPRGTSTSLLSHQAEAALQGSPEEAQQLFPSSYSYPPSILFNSYLAPPHDHQGP
jgi:hypothetical protein